MPQKQELPLFDLPLHANDEQAATSDDDGSDDDLTTAGSRVAPPSEATDREGPPSPRERLWCGLLDLGIQILVLGLTVLGVTAMGVAVSFVDWLPFALFALVFSFLYAFISLAFWGQTPGMAWAGHTAVTLGDEPLTFGQTALRWVGGLVTLLLLGLPLLLAFGGRSLTDRLSESKTVAA